MARIRLSKEPRPAELIEVIRTQLLRKGRGIEDSPVRIITQFWTKDGDLLAEVDPCTEDKKRIELALEFDGIAQHAHMFAHMKVRPKAATKALEDFRDECKRLAKNIRDGLSDPKNVDDPRLGRG